MYIKRNYGLWMTFYWSKRPFIIGFLYSLLLGVLSVLLNFHISIPWQPISVIGLAVAFYLGFKNNSSYDRTWEARKIWGSIVNNSRTLGAALIAFVQGENNLEIKKELIYRHIAWITALRHQLRLSRPWEHIEDRIKGKYVPDVCEDYYNRLNQELTTYISNEEIEEVENKSNIATQILKLQSERLQELRDQGYYEDFRHMELHHLQQSFYEDQGKSERIKNFPFPRQYASTALWLTLVFAAFVPFGLMDVFRDLIVYPVNISTLLMSFSFWLCPILSGLIIWIFFLMEKIGDYSENPFEGSANDVPITSIARAIEIDLREMINDTDIPKAMEPENGFLL